MPRPTYKPCMNYMDIKETIQELGMNYIENTEISVIISHNTKTNAYARVYGLPKAIQIGHNLTPKYTIEFVCGNIVELDCDQISTVFVHELLHIPKTVSGGLRPHGKLVNNRLARRLSKVIGEPAKKSLCKKIKECCSQYL